MSVFTLALTAVIKVTLLKPFQKVYFKKIAFLTICILKQDSVDSQFLQQLCSKSSYPSSLSTITFSMSYVCAQISANRTLHRGFKPGKLTFTSQCLYSAKYKSSTTGFHIQLQPSLCCACAYGSLNHTLSVWDCLPTLPLTLTGFRTSRTDTFALDFPLRSAKFCQMEKIIG